MEKKIQNFLPKLRSNNSDNSTASSGNSNVPKFSLNTNLFSDNQTVPTTPSTWTSSDKNQAKKIKQLLDPRFSPKTRFQSLTEIIEDLPETDTPEFFQEYPDEVFDTIVGMFVRQVNKIRDKGVTSLNSKEMSAMYKTFPYFKKIFLFLPNKVRDGWQESKFTAVFTQLLHFGNHPKLRLEGFQLLLIWLSILKEPKANPIWLYKNAIPLDTYSIDRLDDISLGSNLDLAGETGYSNIGQELIHANDRTPLIARHAPHSYHDSNILFEAAIAHIIQLAFIASGPALPSHLTANQDSSWNNPFPASEYYTCMGMDGANQAAKFMYELFLAYYLTKLFPKVVEKYDSSPTPKPGPLKCAPSILYILIRFLVQNCVDDGSKMMGLTSSSLQIVPSPSCPILKRIIFGSDISRSFLFEILDQGLSLMPYGNSDRCMQIVKGSIVIIQTWLFSDESEKPIFLRKQTDRQSVTTTTPNYDINSNITQLIQLVSRCIDWSVISSSDNHHFNNPDTTSKPVESPRPITQKYCELTELQAVCYTEAFSLLQGIVANHQKIFDYQIISLSCQAQLSITKHLIDILTTNPSVVINYVGGQPFISRWFHNTVEALFRNLFHSWSAAKIKDREMWIQFQKIAIQSTLLSQVTSQWSIVMKKVTHILAAQLYQLETDYNSSSLHDLMTYGTRRKTKGLRSSNSATRLRKQNASNNSDTRTGEPMTRVTSGPAILTESTSNPTSGFLSSRKKKHTASTTSKRDAPVTISDPSAFIHNDESTTSLPAQSKDGFELFSAYYKTIVAPSLPRSSVSSAHSGVVSVGFESTPSIDSRLSDGNQVEPTVLGAKAGVYTHRFSGSPKSQIDFHSITWNEEEAIFIWKNILSCLGDVNSIKEPSYHSTAIQTVVLVYDALENVRSYKAHSGSPVPCSFEMAIWIIYAVDLPALYNDGRLLAYEWMCRAISGRQTNQKVLNAYNSSFYRQLLKGLSRQNFQLFEIILKNTTLMFCRNLPGVNVLAPAFIVAIRGMLIDQSKTENAPKVLEVHRQLALTILSSMIHLPYHFSGLQFPLLSYRLLMHGDAPKMIHVNEIKNHILFILLKLVEDDEWSPRTEKFPSTYAIILNALTLQITYEALQTRSPHIRSIRQCLTAVLDQMYSNQPSVVNVAIDCIGYLTHLVRNFHHLDKSILTSILEDITGSLNVHLNLYSGKAQSDQVHAITRLFTLLTDWILAIPPECILTPELVDLVASILQRGIKQEIFGDSPVINEEQTSNQSPKNPIKDSAHMALNHLLAYFGNHRDFHSGMDAESAKTEPELSNEQPDDPTQFFALNGSSIVSFSQSESGSLLVLVRNFLGKFQWEFNSINTLKPVVVSSEEVFQELRYEFVADADNGHLSVPYIPPSQPNDANDDYIKAIDHSSPFPNTIEDVINYVETAFSSSQPDWIYEQPSFQETNSFELPPLDTISSSPDTESSSLTMSKPPPSPYLDLNTLEDSHRGSKYVLYRALFSSFGLTSPSQFRNGNLIPLQSGPALIRDLKALDRKPNREVIKLALIYVRPGQTSEEEILQNSTRSELYEKFCQSLGREVVLSEHSGYLGGLERGTGTTSIYYATPGVEIMFHDVTRMPTDPNDSTQLKKKRHVGNDPVHIVWNESRGDYNPQTIGGDFGNVQIIVSPLPGGKSFDVRVYKDDASSLFGPLMGPGITLSDVVLADLVRSTAIAAYRTVLHHSIGHGHTAINPTMYRARDIETIVRKHPATAGREEDVARAYGF